MRGVPTVTITKIEILAGLNKPDSFILTASKLMETRLPVALCATLFNTNPILVSAYRGKSRGRTGATRRASHRPRAESRR